MENKEFPKGIIIKKPNEKAPDFVKCNISIKVAEFVEYLQSQKSEWVNFDLKMSKGGKLYVDLNDWKPEKTVIPEAEGNVNDIPF